MKIHHLNPLESFCFDVEMCFGAEAPEKSIKEKFRNATPQEKRKEAEWRHSAAKALRKQSSELTAQTKSTYGKIYEAASAQMRYKVMWFDHANISTEAKACAPYDIGMENARNLSEIADKREKEAHQLRRSARNDEIIGGLKKVLHLN